MLQNLAEEYKTEVYSPQADGYDPASPPLPGSEIYILLQDSVDRKSVV